MNSSAERLTPSDISINPLFFQHLAVYEFVKQFAKGKVVLDMACGEGYGTAVLGKVATEVTGVDYSCAAIMRARKNYASDNIKFIRSDINSLTFKECSFDAICALHFIEHLKKPELFLDDVSKWLKPAGVFLLSTPNRKKSIIQNPYHYREYSQEELFPLLKKFFQEIDLIGLQINHKVEAFRRQRKGRSQRILQLDPLRLHMFLPNFIRRKIFDFVASKLSQKIYLENKSLTESIGINDYSLSSEGIDACLDLICICKK